MADDYLDIVWSGALERRGQCPTLSRYLGPSQLAWCGSQPPILAHGEGIKAKDIIVSTLSPVEREHVRSLLGKGFSIRVTVKETGVSFHLVRKEADLLKLEATRARQLHGDGAAPAADGRRPDAAHDRARVATADADGPRQSRTGGVVGAPLLAELSW